MAFTLKLILLEKQTLGHNEGEWWVVPGSVHRGRKPSARKSGTGSADCPMHTHETWGMNPVQTGPGMGASEHAHANLHSTPRTKSFGGH